MSLSSRKTGKTLWGFRYYILVFACGLAVFYAGQIYGLDKYAGIQGRTVYLSNNGSKSVALTFNVEGDANIEQLRRILDAGKVPAAFFVTDTWARQHESDLGRLILTGHEVGCLFALDGGIEDSNYQQAVMIMKDSGEIISQISGNDVQYYRPVKGNVPLEFLEYAGDAGCQIGVWTLSAHDLDQTNLRIVKARIIKKTRSGEIILFHAGCRGLDTALKDVLTGLNDKGFNFVSLSELLPAQE